MEKLFILGLPGSGKSSAALSIANALAASRIIRITEYTNQDWEPYTPGISISGYKIFYKQFQAAEKELKRQKKFSLSHELGHFAYHSPEDTFLWDDICQHVTVNVYRHIKDIARALLLSLFRYYKNLVKREIKRLRDIAYQTYNRLARSPTPQKKEPPVGGIKIGGKQHGIFRHVSVLYLKPIFILNQAAVP